MTEDRDLRTVLLDHYRQQFLLQREVADRWFRFYILIIGIPFAAIATLAQLEVIKPSVAPHMQYLGALALLLLLLGLCFFCMNTIQRKNSVRFIKEDIHPLERALWQMSAGRADKPGFKPCRFGADFYVGAVIALTNAAWLAGAILFFVEVRTTSLLCAGIAFVSSFALQLVLRGMYLWEMESPVNPEKTAQDDLGT